jgi:hypothetical protein
MMKECVLCERDRAILECSRCHLEGCNDCVCESGLGDSSIVCRLCKQEQLWLQLHGRQPPLWTIVAADMAQPGLEEWAAREPSLADQDQLERAESLLPQLLASQSPSHQELERLFADRPGKRRSILRACQCLLSQKGLPS